MEKSKWVPFHIGHILRLKIKTARIPAETRSVGSDRFALEYGRDVLLLAFFVPLGKRSVNMFLLPGLKLYTHRRLAIECLENGLDDYRSVKGLLRVQATTPCEKRFISFMFKLGFHIECTLKKFNDGIDYLMWARIYGG